MDSPTPVRLFVDLARGRSVDIVGTRSALQALSQRLLESLREKEEHSATVSPELLFQVTPADAHSFPAGVSLVFSLESSRGGAMVFAAANSLAAKSTTFGRLGLAGAVLLAAAVGFWLGRVA
ncbi:MAG TPA: hypothetical protein VGI18_12390 [Burkholderiales bacterium]|jgi:hypothetical protein